jgi:hypothetical protein
VGRGASEAVDREAVVAGRSDGWCADGLNNLGFIYRDSHLEPLRDAAGRLTGIARDCP